MGKAYSASTEERGYVAAALVDESDPGSDEEELSGAGPSNEKSLDEDVSSGEDETMQRLKTELAQLKDSEADQEHALEKLNDFWGSKQSRLEVALEDRRRQIEAVESSMAELEPLKKKARMRPPPGPACLRFVDGDLFMFCAAAVIITNLVCMTLEMCQDAYRDNFFWLDQFFLVFYILEIVLKGVYHQRGLLFGQVGVVWWNWLDLLIVVTGILNSWMLPLLEHGNSGPTWLSYLRMLRLARLARILKIVRVALQSDTSWADGHAFQGFIMCVIGFNALLIGLEADHPHVFPWFYVEHALLIIFTLELFVRLKNSGCKYFYDKKDFLWNWLDFIIVCGGVCDQWLMPFYYLLPFTPSSRSDTMGQIMMMMRMARLLRILRLVRLIKNIPPLYTLVVGIAKAMRGMGWVLVLTVVVLYICALLGVKLVGHGMAYRDEVPPDVADTFPSIPDSVFNLFKVMNADMDPMEDLFHFSPIWKYIMMLYIVITNWAIFSILTAVVSDNMAQVTQAHDEEVKADEEQEKEAESEQVLARIFDSIDSDNSGDITEGTFKQLLADEFQSQELCEAAGLSLPELSDLFEILAREEVGASEPRVYRKDFLEVLKKEHMSVNERSFQSTRRLEKRIALLEHNFEHRMQRLEDMLRQPRDPRRQRGF